MAFIQIIDIRTKELDKLRALDEEWEAATEGKRTLRRSIITQDRNEPDHYMILAFFDSHESAMANSTLPETQTFAEQQTALLDSAPVFFDLDVIDDRN